MIGRLDGERVKDREGKKEEHFQVDMEEIFSVVYFSQDRKVQERKHLLKRFVPICTVLRF